MNRSTVKSRTHSSRLPVDTNRAPNKATSSATSQKENHRTHSIDIETVTHLLSSTVASLFRNLCIEFAPQLAASVVKNHNVTVQEQVDALELSPGLLSMEYTWFLPTDRSRLFNQHNIDHRPDRGMAGGVFMKRAVDATGCCLYARQGIRNLLTVMNKLEYKPSQVPIHSLLHNAWAYKHRLANNMPGGFKEKLTSRELVTLFTAASEWRLLIRYLTYKNGGRGVVYQQAGDTTGQSDRSLISILQQIKLLDIGNERVNPSWTAACRFDLATQKLDSFPHLGLTPFSIDNTAACAESVAWRQSLDTSTVSRREGLATALVEIGQNGMHDGRRLASIWGLHSSWRHVLSMQNGIETSLVHFPTLHTVWEYAVNNLFVTKSISQTARALMAVLDPTWGLEPVVSRKTRAQEAALCTHRGQQPLPLLTREEEQAYANARAAHQQERRTASQQGLQILRKAVIPWLELDTESFVVEDNQWLRVPECGVLKHGPGAASGVALLLRDIKTGTNAALEPNSFKCGWSHDEFPQRYQKSTLRHVDSIDVCSAIQTCVACWTSDIAGNPSRYRNQDTPNGFVNAARERIECDLARAIENLQSLASEYHLRKLQAQTTETSHRATRILRVWNKTRHSPTDGNVRPDPSATVPCEPLSLADTIECFGSAWSDEANAFLTSDIIAEQYRPKLSAAMQTVREQHGHLVAFQQALCCAIVYIRVARYGEAVTRLHASNTSKTTLRRDIKRDFEAEVYTRSIAHPPLSLGTLPVNAQDRTRLRNKTIARHEAKIIKQAVVAAYGPPSIETPVETQEQMTKTTRGIAISIVGAGDPLDNRSMEASSMQVLIVATVAGLAGAVRDSWLRVHTLIEQHGNLPLIAEAGAQATLLKRKADVHLNALHTHLNEACANPSGAGVSDGCYHAGTVDSSSGTTHPSQQTESVVLPLHLLALAVGGPTNTTVTADASGVRRAVETALQNAGVENKAGANVSKAETQHPHEYQQQQQRRVLTEIDRHPACVIQLAKLGERVRVFANRVLAFAETNQSPVPDAIRNALERSTHTADCIVLQSLEWIGPDGREAAEWMAATALWLGFFAHVHDAIDLAAQETKTNSDLPHTRKVKDAVSPLATNATSTNGTTKSSVVPSVRTNEFPQRAPMPTQWGQRAPP
jgi:hypothetical protein